jgi:hypothetical protein
MAMAVGRLGEMLSGIVADACRRCEGRAPAWGETWFYPADGSRAARRIQLQEGRVVDVQVVH